MVLPGNEIHMKSYGIIKKFKGIFDHLTSSNYLYYEIRTIATYCNYHVWFLVVSRWCTRNDPQELTVSQAWKDHIVRWDDVERLDSWGGANLSHGDLQKSTVKILESISISIYIYHRGIILTPTSGSCLDCGWGSRCQATGSKCPISIAPIRRLSRVPQARSELSRHHLARRKRRISRRESGRGDGVPHVELLGTPGRGFFLTHPAIEQWPKSWMNIVISYHHDLLLWTEMVKKLSFNNWVLAGGAASPAPPPQSPASASESMASGSEKQHQAHTYGCVWK